MFLLQVDEKGWPTDDVASIVQIIEDHNWLYPDDEIRFVLASKISENDVAMCNYAYGSIEFVEEFLRRKYGVEHIEPILIPTALNTPKYTKRNVSVIYGKDALETHLEEANSKRLFVKSASCLKGGYTDLYRKGDKLPDDTAYFISDVIDMKSEWRCFVYHRQIVDIRNYCGIPWLIPNKATVEDMVRNYTNAPPAYTLDIAVDSAGDTVIVEVHTFLCCGLYGCTDPKILPMTRAATKWETRKKN